MVDIGTNVLGKESLSGGVVTRARPAPSYQRKQANRMYPRPEGYTPPNEGSLGRTGHYLNTVFVGLVSSAAAGIAVWLLALGGIGTIKDSIEGAELSSSPPWVTITSSEDRLAGSALLTPADLPPGWAPSTDDDDDDDDDVDIEVSEECKSFAEEANYNYAGRVGDANSDDFAGPDKQKARSEASVFSDNASAQGALDLDREAFLLCGDALVAAFTAGFRRGVQKDGLSPDALQLQTAFQDLGPPNVGESGLMFRLSGTVTGPGGSFEFAIDFIRFRVGRMTGGIFYSSLGSFHPEQEQQIAQIAAAKLQTANATLPQP